MKVICGYWALDGAPTPPGTLEAMRTASVRNHAPSLDAWEQGSLAFGSAEWSPQPDLAPHATCIARHAQTGCVVIADARLDNPAELRAALDFPAPRDAPDRDTDHTAAIILRAWLQWGEDCIDRIDGDFAFAVHDPRRQNIFLARDRMGERPLYVHHVHGKLLVFATTSPAVLAHPRVPDAINEARIADYLLECAGGGLEGVDFTSTFHLAVERHPPRHVRVVDSCGQRLRQYWTLQPDRAGPLPRSDGEWMEAVTAAMEFAVAQRLAGPHRVGSMLSGGMDSTALAIIAGDQLRAAGRPRLPTFSAIDSSRPNCLETQAVQAAARMSIFDPTLVDIADLGNFKPLLGDFLDEFDEPFDANMSLLDAQYAAAAKSGLGAVIDGANGDILFTWTSVLTRQIRSCDWSAAWDNAQGLPRIGGCLWDHLRPALRSALTPNVVRITMESLRTRSAYEAMVARSSILPAFALRTNLLDRRRKLRSLRSRFPPRTAPHEAAESLLHTFPVVAAERYHRVAARHGITKLAPFSQRQLMELCIHLPDRQRLRDGWTKYILRACMQERMSDALRLRTDKQHLGGRLTLRLLESHGWRLSERVAAVPTLAGYVEKAKLQSLSIPTPSPSMELLDVETLARWLRLHLPSTRIDTRP